MPPPISRRGVFGLSAAAVVAATTAVTIHSVSADSAKDTKESKDVHPMVIECLADLNARK